MNRSSTRLGPAALVLAGLVAGLWAGSAAAAPLTPAAGAALASAIEDEYRAEAFYAAVIEKFGPVRPFSNIIGAERRHADAIRALMLDYGIEPPQNAFLDDPAITATMPATVADSCRMGVEAEITNRDLYGKQLLPAVTAYPDITATLKQLAAASETRHLPAFQRCASR